MVTSVRTAKDRHHIAVRRRDSRISPLESGPSGSTEVINLMMPLSEHRSQMAQARSHFARTWLPVPPLLHTTWEVVTTHPASILSERCLERNPSLNRICSSGTDTDTGSCGNCIVPLHTVYYIYCKRTCQAQIDYVDFWVPSHSMADREASDRDRLLRS
jgi:hypothetical protein